MEEAQKAQEELTEQYQRDAVQHDQDLSNYENERIRLMNLKDALTRKLIELNQSVD